MSAIPHASDTGRAASAAKLGGDPVTDEQPKLRRASTMKRTARTLTRTATTFIGVRNTLPVDTNKRVFEILVDHLLKEKISWVDTLIEARNAKAESTEEDAKAYISGKLKELRGKYLILLYHRVEALVGIVDRIEELGRRQSLSSDSAIRHISDTHEALELIQQCVQGEYAKRKLSAKDSTTGEAVLSDVEAAMAAAEYLLALQQADHDYEMATRDVDEPDDSAAMHDSVAPMLNDSTYKQLGLDSTSRISKAKKSDLLKDYFAGKETSEEQMLTDMLVKLTEQRHYSVTERVTLNTLQVASFLSAYTKLHSDEDLKAFLVSTLLKIDVEQVAQMYCLLNSSNKRYLRLVLKSLSDDAPECNWKDMELRLSYLSAACLGVMKHLDYSIPHTDKNTNALNSSDTKELATAFQRFLKWDQRFKGKYMQRDRAHSA